MGVRGKKECPLTEDINLSELKVSGLFSDALLPNNEAPPLE